MTYEGCQEAVDEGTCDRELGHDLPHELVDFVTRYDAGQSSRPVDYILIRWPLQRDAPEVQRYYARAAADDPEEAEAQAADAREAQE